MNVAVGELAVFIVVVAVAATAGVAFGILVLAPRLSRHAERSDEDPGAGPD